MYRWAPFHHWSIQHGCQAIICLNRLSGYLAVQGQILMCDSLRSGNVSPLRGDGFIFSRSVRLDRLTLAARHDLTGAGRLGRDDDSAIFRVDSRDRRVRMDRACFRPRTCVANPFRNCLLAQKENHRKEKSGLLQMYHLPVRFWCTC